MSADRGTPEWLAAVRILTADYVRGLIDMSCDRMEAWEATPREDPVQAMRDEYDRGHAGELTTELVQLGMLAAAWAIRYMPGHGGEAAS